MIKARDDLIAAKMSFIDSLPVSNSLRVAELNHALDILAKLYKTAGNPAQPWSFSCLNVKNI
jgi:hypothetical protein